MTDDKDIHLLIEWDTNAITRTVVKPGEPAEITFDNHTAVICHRSDGGDYTTCPKKMSLRRSSFSGHKTLAAPYIFNFQMFLKFQWAFVTQTRM